MPLSIGSFQKCHKVKGRARAGKTQTNSEVTAWNLNLTLTMHLNKNNTINPYLRGTNKHNNWDPKWILWQALGHAWAQSTEKY